MLRPDKDINNYRIRPLSHIGVYPAGDIEIGDDLFLRSGHALFTCVRNTMVTEFGRTTPEQPVFELENWTLNELRLFSSLYLGNGSIRSCRLYPLPIMQDISIESIDDIISDGSLSSDLIKKMKLDTYFMNANDGLVPKTFDSYQTIEWENQQHNRSIMLWERINIKDQILMRGLYTLLKAEMLFSHFQFRNSSYSELHISLDAAHCIILERLRNLGNLNPTSVDAEEYISSLFGQPSTGRRFFQDYYDDRIRNFHADNRFGAESIPNFSVDDVWFLARYLKDLYFTIITDKIYEDVYI